MKKIKKATRTSGNYTDHFFHRTVRRLMKFKSISVTCCLIFMSSSCTNRTELFRKLLVKSDNFDRFCRMFTFNFLNHIEFTRNKLFAKKPELNYFYITRTVKWKSDRLTLN